MRRKLLLLTPLLLALAGGCHAQPDAPVLVPEGPGTLVSEPKGPIPAAATPTLPPGTATPASVDEPRFVPSVFRTFAEWKAACARLPYNRQLGLRLPARELLPLKSIREFEEVLEAFFVQSRTGSLAREESWLGGMPARDQFFDTDRAYFQRSGIPFQPFAQKLTVPPGSEILFHGDLHGDVHSLVAWLDWLNRNQYLNGFRFTRPNIYLVMLGDYTDRGMHGIEVLYTLLRLRLENPGRVILVRGNHEDVTLAVNYGFVAEVQGKYGRDANVTRILRSYDFLPVVIYLGTGGNYIQCNHGGMEPGFNPSGLMDAPGETRFQLLGRLNQLTYLRTHPEWAAQLDPSSLRVAETSLKDFLPENPVTPTTLGFMWNDFTVVPGEAQLAHDPGRAFVYGDRSAAQIMNAAGGGSSRLRAVFRAHQHSSLPNPMMNRLVTSRGVYRHWQERDSVDKLALPPSALAGIVDRSEVRSLPPVPSVWTFNVSPDTVYGKGNNYGEDAFGILRVREKFEDWTLQIVNVPVMLK